MLNDTRFNVRIDKDSMFLEQILPLLRGSYRLLMCCLFVRLLMRLIRCIATGHRNHLHTEEDAVGCSWTVYRILISELP